MSDSSLRSNEHAAFFESSHPCIFSVGNKCKFAGSGNKCNGTTDIESCPLQLIVQALNYLNTIVEQWKTEMVRWM